MESRVFVDDILHVHAYISSFMYMKCIGKRTNQNPLPSQSVDRFHREMLRDFIFIYICIFMFVVFF